MTYHDRYNSEHYLDMTAYLALRNIERKERREHKERKNSKLRDDRDFRRSDLYLADLGKGANG